MPFASWGVSTVAVVSTSRTPVPTGSSAAAPSDPTAAVSAASASEVVASDADGVEHPLADRRTQPGGHDAVGDLQVHRVLVRGVDDGAAQAGRGGDDVTDLEGRLELLLLLHLPALLAPRQEDRDEQQQDEQGEQQAAE